jgi:hypothetical protein
MTPMLLVQALVFLLLPLAFLVAISMIAPSRRWVIALIMIVSGLLGYQWFRYLEWKAIHGQEYSGSPGDYGVAVVEAFTLGWVLAVALYFLGDLWLRARRTL